MNERLGFTSTPSNTLDVKILIEHGAGLDILKNQMVYFDVIVSDGDIYRALGFIDEITTYNALSKDTAMLEMTARNANTGVNAESDYRIVDIKVASVFNNKGGQWKGNSPLPTSPTSKTPLKRSTQETLDDIFAATPKSEFAYLGTLRGTDNMNAPITTPYFGSGRGASHSAILGKTGSGKTAFSTYLLGSQMKHEDHAIIVVDPQGQWSNENGFVFSLQKFAKSLGREVHTLRVSEDIQLELNEDNFVSMIVHVDLWTKLGRMARENRDLLTQEVADYLLSMEPTAIEKQDPKDLLSGILAAIVDTPSTLARIYASEERQQALRNSILSLVDPQRAAIEAYARNVLKEVPDFRNMESDATASEIWERAKAGAGNIGTIPVSASEQAKIDARWQGILNKFTPLMNLFMPRNLSGGPRVPLDSQGSRQGFLNQVLKVRSENPSEPAPYVVLDMSPDPVSTAKQKLMRDKDASLNMKKLLDNESIKAKILSIVFASLKEASEAVFEEANGGNLNTQIVFDEAWRYAPESSDNDIIRDLAKTLEGFALDTRKFGIGWTYILQSPGNLRSGIWKQLKYVYSGYGLVGADLVRIAELMDDAQTQLKTYKQFVSPDFSGEYPFMVTGSISPLITAQIPLFLNTYTNVDDFLSANSVWIEKITGQRGHKVPTATALAVSGPQRQAADGATKHSVGTMTQGEKFTSKIDRTEIEERKNGSYSSDNDVVKSPF